MSEEKNIVTYKWDNGVYSLSDLILLVKYNELTADDFFSITRLKYEAVKEKMGNTN